MTICVAIELEYVKLELEKRGYTVISKLSEAPCNAIICNLKNNGLLNYNLQNSIKTEGRLIIDLKSKKEYRVTTKGGRGRIVYVIKSAYDSVLKSKELAEKMGQTTVFQKVHHAMDVHSHRAIFAKRKYQEVIEDLKEKCIEIKLDYICRDGSGRRFNKQALAITSKNLGHSRLDVIVKNYL